jgi:hypothetical protein
MADRTSAEIFGTLFTHLAEDLRIASADIIHADRREYILTLARDLWPKMWSYDFNEYQMDADDALVQLGLARRVGGEIQYMNQEMTTWQP